MKAPTALSLYVSRSVGEVDAVLLRPDNARWLLVLAHGAGAGMHHPFMAHLAEALAACGVATFRYQFPYMQNGRKSPDPPAVLIDVVRAAIEAASEAVADVPLLAGGKSLGGRMTSHACVRDLSPGSHKTARLRGLVFFGYPLHAAGRPGTQRAEHLKAVQLPMLFLQGTRDRLADLALLPPLCAALGARAALHVVEGADHSFHVLKRTGKTDAEVMIGLANTAASWADALL